jgi:D-alanyl-D-alanine carboxypeptidase/D-alanyl-D-alanine-endopeptidase (penicillin-binding protein 4)
MRSRTTRTVVAALLSLAAVVAVVPAFSGDDTSAASTTTAVATPLWSVRRVPAPVAQAVGAQHLQASLDAAIGAKSSCVVVQVDDHTLAAHNPDAPLLGASTQKLFVAVSALTTLGPDSTFTTKVVAPAAPADGAVERLWLVGSGDPVLATADFNAFLQTQPRWRGSVTTSLETLADAIVAQGVRSIPGGIAGDDSRYDDQRYAPSWRDSYRTAGEIGPMGALTVNQGFSAWSAGSRTPVDDPALQAASRLAALLRARGVNVGTSSHATAPAGTVEVAGVSSPPLRDIVASMLRDSDNLTSELLTKELAVHAGTTPGTTAAGIAATVAKLRGLGVPADQPPVHLVDGSGLSRDDRVTCNVLAATLALADQPAHRALFDGLPVAGAAGTLAGEFLGTPLAGSVRAKTGTLDGVSGLAGFVSTGETLRFAFLDNGDYLEDRSYSMFRPIVPIIARYPDAPAVDALVPPPK